MIYKLIFTFSLLFPSVQGSVCGFEENTLNHCHDDLDATECEEYATQEGLPFYSGSLGTAGDSMPYGCLKALLTTGGNPETHHIAFNTNAGSETTVCSTLGGSFPCICKCFCQEIQETSSTTKY